MLYRNEYFRLGLKEMVYALDSTTIPTMSGFISMG